MSTIVKTVGELEYDSAPNNSNEHPGVQNAMRWRHGKVPVHRADRAYVDPISWSADNGDSDSDAPTQSPAPTISDRDQDENPLPSTPAPSSMPSTPIPSTFPSQRPISSPTSKPSVTVSQGPTGMPSISMMPSIAPSYSPSIKPSISPYPTVSSFPSNTPTVFPDCEVDDNGNFGRLSSSATRTTITYTYELVTNTALSSKPNDAMKQVEIAVMDYLLPQLLGDRCTERRLLETQNSLRHSRRLSTIIGATTKPEDKISSDECISPYDADTKCSIVDGQMQFFSEGDTSALFSNVTDTVCGAMANGFFHHSVHPSITAINCIKNGKVIRSGASSPNESNPLVEPVSQRVSATPLVFSAFAALVVVCGVYFYRRRRDNRRGNTSPRGTAYLDDSDLPNLSGSFSSDTYPVQGFKGVPAMDFSSISLPDHLDSRKNGSISFPDSIEESLDEDSGDMTETSLMHVVSLE